MEILDFTSIETPLWHRYPSSCILSPVMPGIKRASPGADDEKNPLANVELKDEDAQKLQDIQKEIQRVELVVGEYYD